MPFFFVTAVDKAGATASRTAHRQDHLDYWAGRAQSVKVAGAMLEDGQAAGSAFLIEAADETAARSLIEGDPFTVRGVFSGDVRIVTVRPAIGDWFPG